MVITSAMVKELREKTGAGMMDCKEALTASDGDFGKAIDYLRKKGMSAATKRSSKAAKEGTIASYIHMGGKIGVMVELNCETDFVARTEEFKELAHNLALQISAMSPQYLSADVVPQGTDIDPQSDCLLQQPFIKDPGKSVQDIITEIIAKTGENIKVRRFTRYELGY